MQKNSLIDFPGKISCVIFLSGCNFDCPYCHNPSLVRGTPQCPESIKGDGLYDFLRNRTDFLDGVVISGGEPTLQKDLPRLCEMIKGLGYSIKLDTNGSKPDHLKKLLEQGLVDYVAMDIKTDPFHYHPVIKKDCNPDDLLSSISTIMKSAPDYEFRTTCVRGFVDKRIIEDIARLIKGANLYALQPFQDTHVLHPELLAGRNPGFNRDELMDFKSVAEPWVKKCIVR
ncbi:MAG: anaerobic ribonucleoside-triphosphate reductase activating protein [Deltaproteobacteria bacterium]|nr:anaerobic ribonucleoside-triphosphate reductase activating protein [Deltaproteobacteria bacterium]